MKSIFKKTLCSIMLFCLLFLCVGVVTKVSAADLNGTIKFGTKLTKIDKVNVSAKDSLNNVWTIKTVGTTSFTQQPSYSQIGKKDNPATSISFSTSFDKYYNVDSFDIKLGGFKETAGAVTIKMGEVVASGKLNGTNDVTVSTTSSALTNSINIDITDISKGVKVYSISYTLSETSSVTQYTVTFDSDGGTLVDAQNVVENELAVEPADPKKEGYLFKGWYTSEGTKFDFSTPITLAITLTAQWKLISWYSFLTLPTSASLNISYDKTTVSTSVNYYTKVTEALEDYSGEYLIVYEKENANKVFAGLDSDAGQDVVISNNIIEENEIIKECRVKIVAIEGGYSIQVVSGTNSTKYLSGTKGDNKLNFNSNPTINTIDFEDTNVKITSNTSVLRYNPSGKMFRYYKSTSYTSQQPIALYKLSETPMTVEKEDFTFSNASLRFGLVELPVSDYENMVAEGATFGIALTKGETIDIATATKFDCTPVRVNANRVEDANGENYQFAVVINDITNEDFASVVSAV
ncbi:MAG: InlB B-repeat-containing protein, partial [Bacilli bacterium]|nr:InlB B-repeat-containing protein [Bacilli bacterium]